MNNLKNKALILFFLSGCQVYNSSVKDGVRFAGGSPEAQAKAVLANQCGNCHNYSTRTTADLIASGYITPKVAETSLLFYRIQGADAGQKEDMPLGTSISSDELQTIRTWIEGL